jgi:anti-repressor protein
MKRLDNDEKNTLISNEGRKLNIVTESGFYSLVLASRKSEARQFKRWVTHDVIPSIRKNGGYIANQNELSESELMAKALVIAQNVIDEREGELSLERAKVEALEKKVTEMAPKVKLAEAVMASKNSIPVDVLAKILTQNGLKVGRNELYDLFRELGLLIKSGKSKNLPTQEAVRNKLFEVEAQPYRAKDGSIEVGYVTRVTSKGQAYFIHLLLD